MLKYFELERRGSSTVRREVIAGFTTFLTMAYIIFVNPQILSGTGMDAGAVLVATCVAAAFGSAVMGLYANFPIALAPGMGLNAYFAAVVVGTMGLPWQAALGAVFCSGILMLILSVLPDPRMGGQRHSALAESTRSPTGIGFFLFIIGLRSAGVVVGSDATLVTLGNLTEWPAHPGGASGFIAIVGMENLKQPASVLLCILIVAGIGWVAGLSPAPESLVAAPPPLAPTAFELNIAAALEVGLVAIIFAFLMVDLFDTSGTLVAVLNEAGLTDGTGRVPGLQARAGRRQLGHYRRFACSARRPRPPTSRARPGVRAGGRTGHHGARGGGTVPGIDRVRTASPPPSRPSRPPPQSCSCRVCDGACNASCGMGRPDRIRPRDRDRPGHALHLLDRDRDRARLHRLHADQGGGRAPP